MKPAIKMFVIFIAAVMISGGLNILCATESDEKREVSKIEELILKDDYKEANKKCERFLRDYRSSKLATRVEQLNGITLRKLERRSDVRKYGESENISEKNGYEKPKTSKVYIVQVGVYRNYNNAKSISQALKKKGIETSLARTKKGKKSFYRVRAGIFSELANAERLLKILRIRGYKAEIITE